LLTIAAALFYGCTEVEDNSPALQGTLDEAFFKSNDVIGNLTDDDFIVIQGFTEDEIMTLKFRNLAVGTTIEFGVNGSNIATYENPLGVTYATTPGGSGSLTITENRTAAKLVSGTFNFMAVVQGVDTVVVQKGNFFEAPYGTPDNIDVGDGGGNAGTFVAQVNGTVFNPLTVSAVNSGSTIVIAGADSNNNTVLVRVPSDVLNGDYDIPSTGFSAVYSVDSVLEQATSGNISIIDHDTANMTMAGTFSFETANNSITLGQFNVTY